MDNILERSNFTNSQFLIWLGQKLNPEVPLYNMILIFTIEGKVSPSHFQTAFQRLVDQSDALRTVIEEVKGIPQQRVLRHLEYEMTVLDLSVESQPQAALQKWLAKQRVFQFNLEECLFDTALIKIAADKFIWYLNQHHLITDGWSVAVVYQRMAEFYELALKDQLAEAPTLPAFQNYAEYERTYRQSPQYKKAVSYWKQKAEEPFEPIRFYGNTHPEHSTRTERRRCDLGRKRTEKLKAIAMERGIRSLTVDLSLFNIFATLLFTYLHRIGEAQHLAIGTPSHNRPTAAFKETIGLFIELFPLQVKIDDDTFLSLIHKVMRETQGFLRYAQPGTSRMESGKTYNVVLNYINAAFPDFQGLPMHSEWIHPGYGDSSHSLRLHVHDFDESGSFMLHFDFNCDVFSEEQRIRAVEHFLCIVDGFIENRSQHVGQLDLLSEEERRRTLVDYNQTAAPYPVDQTIVQLFETQVQQTPEATALVFEGQELTYRELNDKANQLAHYLKKCGVVPEAIVGICMQRSSEMIVGIYGVLKAGGAYVPIDPVYPTERMTFILEQTQALVLLTQTHLLEQLPESETEIVCLDANWSAITAERTDNPIGGASPENLAYVIYTSGSTGQPKGVSIEHRNLVNYIWWAKKQYLQDEPLDFPLYSSIAFDLTVTSIYVPLISGNKIVVYREDHSTGGDLSILKVIEDNAVEIVKLTPSHLSLIQNVEPDTSRIKRLIVGGEDLKSDLASTITDAFSGRVEIYNEYGPTEATVGCMIHRFDPATDVAASVPIGKPADNAQIYLLDEYLNPVPIGVVGEMYISGDGVARGYLNRPDLTKERFVPDSFRHGQTMYRTGDLARWKSADQMEFLGRADHQVKIRGARIELGEIEAALLVNEDIHDCVVDVVQYERKPETDEVKQCVRCGISSNHPDATLDADGVCTICRTFDEYKDQAIRYFGTMADLHKIVEDMKTSKSGEHDCLMLLSGGKDSTYVLYQLVEMGLKPLVFSFDNGYISDAAKANIRRVVDDLGLDLVFGETPAMSTIFVDSLKRHSNVCNGCFKTIYTLSMNLAHEKGIKYIVTGLSRGQIFETRLADLFREKIFDADKID